MPSFESNKSRLEIPFEAVLQSKMPLSEAFAHKRLRYYEQKRVTSPVLLATPRDHNDAAGIPTQQPNVMIASTTTRAALNSLLGSNRPSTSHSTRRPELRLLSHLHEHGDAVIQYVFSVLNSYYNVFLLLDWQFNHTRKCESLLLVF